MEDQGSAHGLGVGLPATRRPLHIGERNVTVPDDGRTPTNQSVRTMLALFARPICARAIGGQFQRAPTRRQCVPLGVGEPQVNDRDIGGRSCVDT